VKVVDRKTQISVDLCFNQENGLRTAQLVISYLKDPILGPAIQPMLYILKQFLGMRHLNEVYTGGVSSYALLLMVVHFLKVNV